MRIFLSFLVLTLSAAGEEPSRANIAPSSEPQSSKQDSTEAHAGSAAAQQPQFRRPMFLMQREEENWSFLAEPSTRTDPLDSLKYIPLGRGNWYVTLGGGIREWFDAFKNENWGAGPAEVNSWLLQRIMLHGDFHFGDRFRVFGQLKSGISMGREGGPRPVVDEDKLDVNQAFMDINFGIRGGNRPPALTFRAGRQEMSYGAGRLVALRETNSRLGFDGLRMIVHTGDWRVDTFAVRPSESNPGVFDDSPDHTQTFWGVYGTGRVPSVPLLSSGSVDVYYLGLARKMAVYDQGVGSETRHTVGGRIWRQARPVDYEIEAAFQFGSFGPGSIRAWHASTDTGYTFEGVRFTPRLGLNTGIASGDRDPADPDLETFYAPFPNARYFGNIQQNGPMNVTGFRPNVRLNLPRRAMLTFDCFFFWRQRLNDGLYAVPGFPLRTGRMSRARYIGTQPQVELLWPVTPHVIIIASYASFFAGRFLKETPPGKDMRYANVALEFTF